ncbi:MAG: hypothetical protein SF187_28960 [Deltaproteobacteria bacterium]|nr:hypothetical protein [Deltaproteobacteria bacterium]
MIALMPSTQQWLDALIVPRRVRVDSSVGLAKKVAGMGVSKSFKGTPKKAVALPSDTFPNRVHVRPAELLYYVAKATLPQIENLCDLSSTSALLRYIWAFEPKPSVHNLKLSKEALGIDFHQKMVMSDEIGCGMGCLFVERYLRACNPVPISMALADSANAFGISKKYSTSPDFIFAEPRPDGRYVVLECKGSRSGRANSERQLRRGLEQVPSIVFSSPPAPLAVVMATSLSKERTEVLVLDPEGRPTHVRDRTEFATTVSALGRESLIRFAGAIGLARRKARERESKQPDFGLEFEGPLSPPAEKPSPMGIPLVGFRQSAQIGDVRVELFRGISTAQFRALETDDIERSRAAANQLFGAASALRRGEEFPGPVVVARGSGEREQGIVSVVGPDGTAVLIEASSE